jgi:hypothetical protein
MGATGGIEDQHVITAQAPFALGAAGDLDRGFGGNDGQRIDADLLAQHAQLLHGGGAAGIERGQQDFLLLAVLEALGDLGGGGGFARALQAHHHEGEGRGGVQIQRHGFAAERLHQFVMHDLDHLLTGRDRAGDLYADGAILDLFDKGADHFERDVGLDQGTADFARRRIDIGSVERAASAESVEDFAKPV